MAIAYRKEFFDREYSLRECYSRAWKYVWRYRFRLIVGLACGMLTAGTMLPLLQSVRPILSGAAPSRSVRAAGAEPAGRKTDYELELDRAARLPGWYPQAENVARRFGIRLQGESGGIGGPLVVIACVVVPLVALLRLLLVFLNHYCLMWVAKRAIIDLRADVLAHVQHQSLRFFGLTDVGQLMARTNADPRVLNSIVRGMLAELLRSPVEILLALGFAVWYAVTYRMIPTLVVILFAVPVFVFPVRWLGRIIRRWCRQTLETGSAVTAHVHETLTCVGAVKTAGCEAFEAARYRRALRQLLDVRLRTLRWGLAANPLVDGIGVLMICGFLIWCRMAHVSLVDLVPMLTPLLVAYKPIRRLSGLQMKVETARVSLQRLWSLMDCDMAIPERPDAAPKEGFDDRIAFDGVSFRYDSADRDAVRDVSFEIPRGRTVAVVGETGGGKSTLTSLLARFYDPRTGRVTLDGTDLRDLRICDVRRLIGMVQQETVLFNDTIEENVRYGSPNATHEEVVAAAKMANAHDFIVSHPEGYGRLVGEKGFALSGGERQRICIARAILRNPPVLVLDEATSALDTVTERLVQDALDRLMRDRTVFVIAHRLSTIRKADLILVMRDGRIVERGTHDGLYAADGVYRKLCDLQGGEGRDVG